MKMMVRGPTGEWEGEVGLRLVEMERW